MEGLGDLGATADVEAIYRDLSTIASHPGGFERPEALSQELRCVPELRCVMPSRASSEPVSSRMSRVLGVREVLRTTISRVRDPATRTAASLLLFTCSTTELRKLGQDDDFFERRIGERRELIGALLGLKGFRQNHEPRVLAIVAGELARIEVEADLSARYEAESEAVSTPGDADIGAVKQALKLNLGGRYRGVHSIDSLVDVINPDRTIYYAADLDIQLRASDRSDCYEYATETTFQAEMEEYVVAYVVTPDVTDEVLARCPRITDVYSCSTPEARDRQAEKAVRTPDMIVLLRHEEGQLVKRGVPTAIVEDGEKSSYLGNLDPDQQAEVLLVRATFPPRASTQSRYRRLRVKQTITLPLSDHFCYWLADRPIFVRRLNVDVRGLSQIAEGHGPRLQPFAMSGRFGARLRDEPVQHLDVENWFVRGQGLAIIW